MFWHENKKKEKIGFWRKNSNMAKSKVLTKKIFGENVIEGSLR